MMSRLSSIFLIASGLNLIVLPPITQAHPQRIGLSIQIFNFGSRKFEVCTSAQTFCEVVEPGKTEEWIQFAVDPTGENYRKWFDGMTVKICGRFVPAAEVFTTSMTEKRDFPGITVYKLVFNDNAYGKVCAVADE